MCLDGGGVCRQVVSGNSLDFLRYKFVYSGIEGLQLRDLRRTCATRLHEAGVDPLIIKRFMRHASSGMTEKVYIHSSLKMMKQALDEVDKVPEASPFQSQFRTPLEHETKSEKNGA